MQTSNTASCTNLQCTITKDTSELLAVVNPLAYFNAKWYNNQLDLEVPQISKISNDSSEAFTAPMHELVYKYADIFAKPGKPVAQDIKPKIELLDPAKPKPYQKLQIMSEKISKSIKEPERIPRERLDTDQYISVQSPHIVHLQEN